MTTTTDDAPAQGAAAANADSAPSLPGLFADPNLVVLDGRYYLYPTTDGTDEWASDSFSVFSSDDLAEWTDHGVILSVARDVAWAAGQAWAPAIAHRDGSYFFYFTAESNIGVAVSATPAGPFVDTGKPLVAADAFTGRAIDPSIFVDDDGTHYLLWGNTVAHIVPLADDMVSFDAASVHDFVPTGFCEAVWMHKRDGVYYLSWSENDTRDVEYRVRYATASSPVGPWVDHGVLIEQRPDVGVLATGHHSIVQIPGTDDWLIAYHRFAIPGGNGYRREIVVDHLRHEPGGLLRPVRPERSSSGRRHPMPPAAAQISTARPGAPAPLPPSAPSTPTER